MLSETPEKQNKKKKLKHFLLVLCRFVFNYTETSIESSLKTHISIGEIHI